MELMALALIRNLTHYLGFAVAFCLHTLSTGFLLKGDYLAGSSWGILESLLLLLSALGTLAGKKCGRQVLWLNTLVSQ